MHTMSYDLAVWEGKRPFLGRGASRTFERLMDEQERGEAPRPASPAIADFVAELLAHWPDLDDDNEDECPWAAGPLIQEASGSHIYFAMTWDGAEYAVPTIAQIARRRGLVCYDPQADEVL